MARIKVNYYTDTAEQSILNPHLGKSRRGAWMGVNGIVNKCQRRGEEREGGRGREGEREGEREGGRRGGGERGGRRGGGGEGGGRVAAVQCWGHMSYKLFCMSLHYIFVMMNYIIYGYFCVDRISPNS